MHADKFDLDNVRQKIKQSDYSHFNDPGDSDNCVYFFTDTDDCKKTCGWNYNIHFKRFPESHLYGALTRMNHKDGQKRTTDKRDYWMNGDCYFVLSSDTWQWKIHCVKIKLDLETPVTNWNKNQRTRYTFRLKHVRQSAIVLDEGSWRK